MKIKLIRDIPVDQAYGLIAGKILETTTPPEDRLEDNRGVWVQVTGQKVKILFREYEVVKEPQGKSK